MPNDTGGWNRGAARCLTLGLLLAGAIALLAGVGSPLSAQTQGPGLAPAAESRSVASGPYEDALPDAPVPVEDEPGAQSSAQAFEIPARTHAASPHDRLIDPSEIAPSLRPMDKVVMGLEGAVSPYAVVGWVGVATYEQAFDRSPNYGQTAKGYVQRLGAGAARASSEGIFTNSLYSPLFHTDPRYYILGPGYGFVQRTFHAVSRVFVTRTDGGHETIDFALIAGNLTGAAVTQTYYPAGNRNLDQVLTTFGTSLGGSAVGYLFDEFIVNSAEFLQLKHKVDLKHGSASN